MKKTVLGFDIGKASIGWAVVELDESILDCATLEDAKYKIDNGCIKASGVRCFKEPVNDKGKSLAKIRGENRRSRATIERKAERLKYFVKLAKQYNIVEDNFSIKEFSIPAKTDWKEWDVWKLRANAIKEKLSPFEVFRILYHIANHRGFYFPTKAEQKEMLSAKKEKNESEDEEKDEKASESKKVKAGIALVRKNLEQSGCKTVGEYIYKNAEENPKNNLVVKRNKNGSYNISIYRTELEAEVKEILKFQRSKGNTIFSEEFEERYLKEVLYYNHPVDELKLQKMMGMCEFEPDEIRFPKKGYEAELFAFYNRLNNLKITNREDEILKPEERKKVLDFVLNQKNGEMSFTDLRTCLNLSDYNMKFNLCNYREFNPEYEKTVKIKKEKIEETKIAEFDYYHSVRGEILGNCWEDVKQRALKYFDNHPDKKEVKYYYSDIRKYIQCTEDYRFSAIEDKYCKAKSIVGDEKYFAQFEKDIFVSFSGYALIKKGLGEYFEQLSKSDLNVIAETLVYCKSDETRKQYLQEKGIDNELIIDKILELNMKDLGSFSRKALEKLNSLMERGVLFNEAKEKLGYGVITNEKTTLIEPYSGPFENNATVSRIIAQFRKLINAIVRKYKVIDEIHIEVATDVANSKDKIARIRNGQTKYKEQRDSAKERCREDFGIDPDEGDNLLRVRLAEEQDWFCPYSGKHIFAGDIKDTPKDDINIFECDIDHIIPISRSFNDSLTNKVICSSSSNKEKTNKIPYEYFRDFKTEEEWRIFKDRVIKLNRMSSAKKRNLLRESFTEEDMKNFISRDLNNTRYATRHIAEYLRKYFSFEQSKNDTIKDVNRIRVLGGGITAKLRHMWGLNKNRDENDKHHAQDAIVIACASFGHIYYICSVLKKLEEKGIRPGKDTKLVPWDSFREDVAKSLDDIFVSRPPRKSATGSAHDATIYPLKENHKNYNKNVVKSGIPVRDGKTPNGDMFRTDVFVKKNKKGKDEFYLVPIYTSQLGKELPNKAIVADKPEEEWIIIDDTFEFKFSLFKEDYIKVKQGNEYIEGYFKGTDRSNGRISIIANDNSFKDRFGSKTLAEIKKYAVDVLGNKVEIKKEKRVPLTLRKNDKQRREDRAKRKQQKG